MIFVISWSSSPRGSDAYAFGGFGDALVFISSANDRIRGLSMVDDLFTDGVDFPDLLGEEIMLFCFLLALFLCMENRDYSGEADCRLVNLDPDEYGDFRFVMRIF